MNNTELYGLFEHSPVPMWVFNMDDFRFLDVNIAATLQYGYSREEFLTMNINDIRRSEDALQVDDLVDSHTGTFFKDVFRHLTKRGHLIHVQIASNTITYGGMNARVVLAMNVTERVNAEKALLENERRFKALVQDGSDMITIIDGEFRYRYVSPASERVFGVAPEFFIGKKAFDFIHRDDLERVNSEAAQIWERRTIQLSPYRYKDASGGWIWVETKATNLFDDPAVAGIVCTSTDVTARKRGEEWSKLLESVVVNTSDGVLITSGGETPVIIYVNQAMVEMSGYSKEELIGSFPDILHGSHHDQPKLLVLKAALDSKIAAEVELVNYTKQGKEYFVSLSLTPVFGEDGELVRWISIQRDVSEGRRYVDEIESKNKKLQDISWLQSHVVRTPLARIMSLVELLEGTSMSREQLDLLNHMSTSADELDSIIRKIANNS